jgi:hypothetical protein
LLRVSERREVAIYLDDGVAWVADFKDGHGEVSTASAWLALNHNRSTLRRAGLDGAITPLSPEIVQRIENPGRPTAQPGVPGRRAVGENERRESARREDEGEVGQ